MPRITVQNKTTYKIYNFVSNYNGGSDLWYPLEAGQSDPRNRDTPGFELVAFRVGGEVRPTSDESCAGVYARFSDKGSTVEFHGLNDIRVIE